MPFKTKARKLKAANRFVFNEGTFEIAGLAKGSFTEITPKKQAYNLEDLSYIGSDLVRIVAASSIIIGAQIFLSLTLS